MCGFGKWKETSMLKTSFLATAILALPLAFGSVASAQTAANKPNIVVIMADDVGIWNVSAYHRGMMGGSTPNIDRIAKEGALFTDYYAQQSCTAGRAAFILGQTPFRTGLLTAGSPAAKEGIQDKDPTITELLKPYGYATAQIGKNHLGARALRCRRLSGGERAQPLHSQQLDAFPDQRRWVTRPVFPEREPREGQGSQLAARTRKSIQPYNAPLQPEVGCAHRQNGTRRQ
jgi:arylsulfatase A-like enzyme